MACPADPITVTAAPTMRAMMPAVHRMEIFSKNPATMRTIPITAIVQQVSA
jgi:hypothetical protein